MLEYGNFESADKTIAGIEIMHMVETDKLKKFDVSIKMFELKQDIGSNGLKD